MDPCPEMLPPPTWSYLSCPIKIDFVFESMEILLSLDGKNCGIIFKGACIDEKNIKAALLQ